MFLVAIAVLAGVCIVHASPTLPPLAWCIAPAVVAVAAFWLRAHRSARVVMGLMLGIAWAWLHGALRLAEALPPDTVQVDAEVTGYVSSLVGGGNGDVRFALDVVESTPQLPPRIELTWYDVAVAPAPGEHWRLRVRVRPPRGFANPGGSDYAAQMFRKRVGATGYVRDTKKDVGRNVRLQSASWRYAVLRARAVIAARIEHALGDSPQVGIVQGLAVGDTHRIAPEQWRVFSTTGTTHLLAISGLHVGMVAALAAWIGGWCARRLPLQARAFAAVDAQALAGMSAAVVYAALAGFSVPTQRTLVMLVAYFGARVSRRNVGVTQGLALALLGVLLIDPFAPLAPGFWLSFGAVAAIFLATSGRIARPNWARGYLQLQAAVSIGLMPLLIGAFGGVSLIAPLVNLAAIPLYTFAIVPAVLLGSFAVFVNEWFGAWMLRGGAWLLDLSWPAFQWAADLPWAMWHLPQLPLWAAALLALGCCVLIAPGVTATRVAGAVLCLPALLWQPPRPQLGEFDVAVLDVGQGLAVVIATHAHALVYDTGPSFRSGRDTGEMVVLPYLHSRGIRRVDAMMISHGDDDHAGGAESVWSGMEVSSVLAGPSVAFADANVLSKRSEPCARGQQWEWDGVTFAVLHPSQGDAARDNDSSCVLHVRGAGGSAVLLGDIERDAETELLADGRLRRADIVLVPHHGSRTSSSEALTRALAPQLAVVSAGFGNRWGFPKRDVLDRWRAVGARTLNTADSGAIEIAVAVDGPKPPREHRAARRAYWAR